VKHVRILIEKKLKVNARFRTFSLDTILFTGYNFCMTTIIIARTRKEIETRRRIKLSVWAYAYEIRSHSIVTDAVYDVEARLVDLSVETNRLDLDYWFRAMFTPDTGMWIYQHPELSKIEKLYERFYQ
jgi:hypothetical protein